MLEEEGYRKKIILASASPGRRKILELLKLDFEVIEPKNCGERGGLKILTRLLSAIVWLKLKMFIII